MREKYSKEKKEIKSKKITVIEINPCFELWFLLHYKKTTKYFKDCGDTIKCLKKISLFSKYEKTQRYFEKKDFYKLLLDRLTGAINNSKWMNKRRKKHEHPKCDVFKIIEGIQNFN